MDKKAILIRGARNFQRYGEHELAIQMLEKAQMMCSCDKELAEIEMMKSFSYRGLDEYENALSAINNAISINNCTGGSELKYAKYLMNKGIILECLHKDVDAVSVYRKALSVFRKLYSEDKETQGLLINALITISLLFDKLGIISAAKNYLEEAKCLFGKNEKEDRRYYSIINTLNAYENN